MRKINITEITATVVSASDCAVKGPRFESHRGRLCLSRQPLRYTVVHNPCLGQGLCTFTAVPRSNQPSTLRGMVKWVSAFELSN